MSRVSLAWVYLPAHLLALKSVGSAHPHHAFHVFFTLKFYNRNFEALTETRPWNVEMWKYAKNKSKFSKLIGKICKSVKKNWKFPLRNWFLVSLFYPTKFKYSGIMQVCQAFLNGHIEDLWPSWHECTLDAPKILLKMAILWSRWDKGDWRHANSRGSFNINSFNTADEFSCKTSFSVFTTDEFSCNYSFNVQK